jgi:hypothetical protein
VVDGERSHAGRQGVSLPPAAIVVCCILVYCTEEYDPRTGSQWQKTPRWAARGILAPLAPLAPRGHREKKGVTPSATLD